MLAYFLLGMGKKEPLLPLNPHHVKWLTQIRLSLRVMRSESLKLTKFVTPKGRCRVHRLNVRSLKVTNDELVETAQFRHTRD